MNRSLASSSLACGCSCRTYWLPASIVEAVHDWTKAKRLLIGALRIIPMSTSSASRLVSGDCVFIVSLPLAHSPVESVANTREGSQALFSRDPGLLKSWSKRTREKRDREQEKESPESSLATMACIKPQPQVRAVRNLNQGQVQYIKGYADALENMAARMG